MKKSDWIYLASAMWEYSEKHEGQISDLLKQLIKEINKEMIINDNEQISEASRKHRPKNPNSTSDLDYTGSGGLSQ